MRLMRQEVKIRTWIAGRVSIFFVLPYFEMFASIGDESLEVFEGSRDLCWELSATAKKIGKGILAGW
jgi:hypothetical protein